MKKITFLILTLFFTFQALSQNETDALRYSQHNIFGTTKFTSMGGSFGALGADFSCLSYNPAGISLYQNSELTISPNITNITTTSYLNSNKNTNYTLSGNFSNLGYITSASNNDKQWTRINWGAGFNLTSDFKNAYIIQSENNYSSLSDLLLEQANGNTIDNLNSFGAGPAFWSDLIDLENNLVDTITNWYAFDNGNYISNVNSLSNKTQTKSIVSDGEMGEAVFSMGTTYEDKIYIGATIGIPTIEYRQISTYTENRFEDTSFSVNNFTYNEDLLAYGSGINIKIGGIIRIGENTKIGGAVHSPSYISIEEEYTTSIQTEFNNGTSISESSPLGYFNYNIITPWKAIASISTILNKESSILPKIILNADIEQTDYSFTRMYSDYYQFSDENKAINTLYGTATNIRIGGETLIYPFKIRAGYALYGSPLKDFAEYQNVTYSCGLGVDFSNVFFDIGYSINHNKTNESMYNPDEEPNAILNSKRAQAICTFGFRF